MEEGTALRRAAYVDENKIRTAINHGPFDAVITMAIENVPYMSGFYNHDIRMIFERFHFVVWPRGKPPAFVVVEKRKATLQAGDTFIEDVRPYQGEGLDAVRVVAEVLQDRGITHGLIGIEGRTFPAGHAFELKRLLPRLEFADAYHFVESLRVIKLPGEVATLKRIAQATADAQDYAFRMARPGDTEKEISANMQAELIRQGADVIAETILGSGWRTGFWHTLPTMKRVEDGELIRSDLAGILDGYYSDIGRTVVMGKASKSQIAMHAKLTEIKHLLVDAIQPGMLASDLAAIGKRAYSDSGLDFKGSILGHSIGLAVHETPQVYDWDDTPILTGMTMNIEVGYMDPPNESYLVEDLVHVGESGASYLVDVSAHEHLWELV